RGRAGRDGGGGALGLPRFLSRRSRQVIEYAREGRGGGPRRVVRGAGADAEGVQDPVQAGRVGTPLAVHDLLRVVGPVDRRPVLVGVGGTAVEEAGGQQGGRLVHHAGLLQQVAGGALAEPGGEPLGQPV